MGSTTTNGKNHVLAIDSGTPTEPKRRIFSHLIVSLLQRPVAVDVLCTI